MKLDQPDSHHGEICHHVVFAEERAQRAQDSGSLASRCQNILIRRLRIPAPMPSIFERSDLRRRFCSGWRPEQHVEAGVRVEWRIQVNEIDALAFYMFSEDVKIISEIEHIGHKGGLRAGAARANPKLCRFKIGYDRFGIYSYARASEIAAATTYSGGSAKYNIALQGPQDLRLIVGQMTHEDVGVSDFPEGPKLFRDFVDRARDQGFCRHAAIASASRRLQHRLRLGRRLADVNVRSQGDGAWLPAVSGAA